MTAVQEVSADLPTQTYHYTTENRVWQIAKIALNTLNPLSWAHNFFALLLVNPNFGSCYNAEDVITQTTEA